VVLDDRQIRAFGDTADLLQRLQTILPDRVERIERLYRGRMLRIYTRDYIRQMMASDKPLRKPALISQTSPPTCY
jgi:hypothetical protein